MWVWISKIGKRNLIVEVKETFPFEREKKFNLEYTEPLWKYSIKTYVKAQCKMLQLGSSFLIQNKNENKLWEHFLAMKFKEQGVTFELKTVMGVVGCLIQTADFLLGPLIWLFHMVEGVKELSGGLFYKGMNHDGSIFMI